MQTPPFVLLTIVAESAIEESVLRELAMAGVTQFTATDVTSARRRERPEATWALGRSLRIDAIREPQQAIPLSERLHAQWGMDHQLTAWIQNIHGPRPALSATARSAPNADDRS